MRRQRILIIEDDYPFAHRISALLSGAGYDVITAESAEAAVPVLDREAPDIDLLMCDLVLPGLSGLDLIGIITRRPRHYRLIAMSHVFRNPTLEFVSRSLGADAFLEKSEPLDADEWLSTVRRVIGKRSGEAAP